MIGNIKLPFLGYYWKHPCDLFIFDGCFSDDSNVFGQFSVFVWTYGYQLEGQQPVFRKDAVTLRR